MFRILIFKINTIFPSTFCIDCNQDQLFTKCPKGKLTLDRLGYIGKSWLTIINKHYQNNNKQINAYKLNIKIIYKHIQIVNKVNN